MCRACFTIWNSEIMSCSRLALFCGHWHRYPPFRSGPTLGLSALGPPRFLEIRFVLSETPEAPFLEPALLQNWLPSAKSVGSRDWLRPAKLGVASQHWLCSAKLERRHIGFVLPNQIGSRLVGPSKMRRHRTEGLQNWPSLSPSRNGRLGGVGSVLPNLTANC